MAGSSVVEGMLVDWVRTRPAPEPRPPVAWMSPEEKAAELDRIQANRAREAAREAELILGPAADRPDSLDPPPGTPGARTGGYGAPNELPGVSQFFPAELSAVLDCGRGTAAYRARRAGGGGRRPPPPLAPPPRGAGGRGGGSAGCPPPSPRCGAGRSTSAGRRSCSTCCRTPTPSSRGPSRPGWRPRRCR